MRVLVLVVGLILLTGDGRGQVPELASNVGTSAPRVPQALSQALVGRWTGTLEYRDYSEPVSSTKRVQLPTWLTIQAAPEGLSLDYVYDDGPTKTVREHSVLVLDADARTYKIVKTDAVSESYTIEGLEQLREGRGTLVLTGKGTDNKQPAEIRTTWTVRRNLLSWLEEVRPAGSAGAYAFRHRYTFTRAEAPAAP